MAGSAVTLSGGKSFIQFGSGHDTVSIYGNTKGDTIEATGKASIVVDTYTSAGAQTGAATIKGGTLDIAVNGKAIGETVSSGSAATLVGGSGADTLVGGATADTLIAGSGLSTLIGGSGKDLFVIGDGSFDSNTVIKDFTPGTDQLYVEGNTFADLKNDITYSGGNAIIKLGGVTITVEGDFSKTHPLTKGDFTTKS